MRILFLTGGGDIGGAKTHILSLASRLKEKNDLRLVAFRPGEFANSAEEAGLSVTVFDAALVTRDLRGLVRLFDEFAPEVVHCHGAKANMMGALLKTRRKSAAYITTLHSDYKKDYAHSPIKQLIYGGINARALRRMDDYVTVSDDLARRMIEAGFPSQSLFPIVNGLDFSKENPATDRAAYFEKLGLPYETGDVVAGFAARLTAVKDVSTLLRGFAKASETSPRLKLVIAGEGEQRPMLESLAKELGIADRVCFAGWVKDMDSLLSAVDWIVLSSLTEGFPYTIVEGARAGLPILSTAVGGIPTLIRSGETGLLFAPGDVDALASHLTALAESAELREKLGAAVRAEAKEKFSLSTMCAMQEGIYQTVLRRKARPRRDGVVVCGAYGKGNAGDDAIQKAVVQEMRRLDPDMPVTVVTRKPAETRLAERVDAVYTFDFPALWRRFSRCRLYLNGGGSLIQDVTSSRSLYYYLATLRLAKRRGAAVFMYGCGIGPVEKPMNRRLAAGVISKNVDCISLREALSMEELSRMGVKGPEIFLAADPAMSLFPAPSDRVDEAMAAEGLAAGESYLCFCLRDWKGGDRAPLFAQVARDAYRRHGLIPVFLAAEWPRDRAISHHTAGLLQVEGVPCRVVDHPYPVEVVIGLLGRMRTVVAMRLHALIFAASQGVPIVGVSYDVKVEGFMRSVESDSWLLLEELDVSRLSALIDGALEGQGVSRELKELLARRETKNRAAAARLLGLPFDETPQKEGM